MKVVKTGNIFRIYDNTLETFNALPANTYNLRFSKTSGFYLESHAEIEVSEPKIYGPHYEKAQKVLKTFKMFERNLGIILSGDKGIGKSLCAKLLSIESTKAGYPLIIVDSYFPGIATFLESIEQEVVVLFDEFDKTFSKSNEANPQVELLSLFDGVAVGKKMFVLTCNNITGLNEFLVNRPGRFHYHFRFDYPTGNEVKEYLEDKMVEAYYGEISKVVSFAGKVNLNYDCLRAIAFELNLGTSFEDAIKDLNIIRDDDYTYYRVLLKYSDGTTLTNNRAILDLFDGEMSVWFDSDDEDDVVQASFPSEAAASDAFTGQIAVNVNMLKLSYSDYDGNKEIVEQLKKKQAIQLTINRVGQKNIHYIL